MNTSVIGSQHFFIKWLQLLKIFAIFTLCNSGCTTQSVEAVNNSNNGSAGANRAQTTSGAYSAPGASTMPGSKGTAGTPADPNSATPLGGENSAGNKTTAALPGIVIGSVLGGIQGTPQISLPAPAPMPASGPVEQSSDAQQTGPGSAPKIATNWNAWLESNHKSLPSLTLGTGADVVIDLSKFAYTNSSGVATSTSLNKLIEQSIAENKMQLRLTFRAILSGSGIEFGSGAVTDKTIDLDLSRLKNFSDKAFFDDPDVKQTRNSENSELLPTISNKYSFGTFRVPIRVSNAPSQCGQIAFSIWDAGDSRPLDHIVFTFPVTDGVSVNTNNCGVPRMQGGFGTMAGSLTSRGDTLADAALHFFEFASPFQQIKTKVVYVDIAKYRKTGPSPTWQSRGVFTWQIDGSLAQYLGGTDLLDLIEGARRKGDYSDAAEEIREKLFPNDPFDPHHQASEAFKSLANLPSHSGRSPTLLVRAVMVSGQHLYAPLTMLHAGGKVRNRFNVIFPLPRENYSSTSCIQRWTIGYPDQLSTGAEEAESMKWDAASMEFSGKRSQRLHNLKDLRCYLNTDTSGCNNANVGDEKLSQTEALLLLAHHSNGLLWFKNTSTEQARFPISSENKIFPAGSVAFLNACSVANPTGDNLQVLTRLNRSGVDAMIVSPFPIKVKYAELLSRALIQVVKSAYDKGATPTVLEIFEEATERVTKESNNKGIANTRYEFVALGNHQIRLCK